MAERLKFFKPLPELPVGKAMLLRFLMLPNYFLTRATGLENLPAGKEPCIFAFNHNNSLEALMVPVFFIYQMGGSTISFVIDWMYGKLPLLGNLMAMIDPIYVYSKRSSIPWIEAARPVRAAEDTLERCCRKIMAGRSIGIFPEGRRNPDPKFLVEGKRGVGHIALRTGVPIVPIGIDFPARTSRGRIPVLGHTILRVGAPLQFSQLSDGYRALDASAPGTLRERSQMAEEVTRTLMLRLSALSGKGYGRAGACSCSNFANNTLTEESLCQS